jgi:hypothetical protein
MRFAVIALASALLTANLTPTKAPENSPPPSSRQTFAETRPDGSQHGARERIAQQAGNPHVYVYLLDNGGPSKPAARIAKRGPAILQMGIGDSPWRIAQKNNPIDLITSYDSATAACSSPPLWSATNLTTRVCWIPDGTANYKVELAQHQDSSTPNVICGGDTSVSEYDLFLGSPSPELRNSPTLDRIASLNYFFGLQIPSARVTKYCGAANPWWDQAAIEVALVLGNQISKQQFYYQIKLKQFLPNSPNICNSGKSYWYFTKGSLFSANDYSGTVYGQPCPVSGDPRRRYTFDPLPRLKYFIQNSPAGMDKDLSHWRIADYYVGSMGYGDFSVTTVWDHISLTANIVTP